MLEPSHPLNEAARLAALRALKILDTPAEARFDRITAFARTLFEVPIALVSLVDRDRQWFKSKTGLDAAETPRAVSLCGHAILTSDIFVVEDASIDARFSDNPLVTGPPFVRFYAGAPLNITGFTLGTLCLLDHQPRHFTDREKELLGNLAGWVERELGILSDLQTMAIRLESQARLEAVLDGVIEGVITTSESGQIQTANPAAARIFACERDDLIGRHLRDLVPQTHRSAHEQYLLRLNSLPDPVQRTAMQTTGRRFDGAEFPIELSFNRINVDGQRIYSGIVRDISERKALERLQSEFVSTVNHELRTPLTAIVGALDILQSGTAGALPEAAREFVAMAAHNSERLTSLVEDLLDLEKLQNGQIQIILETVPLATLLDRSLALSEDRARRSGVRLELTHAQQQTALRVDPQRLLQVLGKLISNAIKYSAQGQSVQITARHHGEHVSIRVQDQGPGIPDEFRSRIFQRFARADSSDTRKVDGAGLGLHIAKELVERMAGEIGIDTAYDSGTAFWVRFPALNKS